MSLQGQSVFVTGATGFVGSALALRLAAEGAHVKALVRSLQKSHILRNSPHSARIEVVHGDITNLERLQTVMEDCTTVFHVAAALRGSFALQREVNINGTRNIMRAAHQTGIKHVVHISSIAVYGFRCTGTITEDRGCQPSRDAYAITKAQGEAIVREFGSTYDLPHTILRAGAIFGPHSWWNRTLTRMASRPLILCFGAGEGTLPAVDLDDVIDMCLLAAEHPAAVNETFTLVHDPAPSMRAALELFATHLGRTNPNWLHVALGPAQLAARIPAAFAPPFSRFGDLPEWFATLAVPVHYSMDKARKLLGAEPRYDLAASIERTQAAMEQHTIAANQTT